MNRILSPINLLSLALFAGHAQADLIKLEVSPPAAAPGQRVTYTAVEGGRISVSSYRWEWRRWEAGVAGPWVIAQADGPTYACIEPKPGSFEVRCTATYRGDADPDAPPIPSSTKSVGIAIREAQAEQSTTGVEALGLAAGLTLTGGMSPVLTTTETVVHASETVIKDGVKVERQVAARSLREATERGEREVVEHAGRSLIARSEREVVEHAGAAVVKKTTRKVFGGITRKIPLVALGFIAYDTYNGGVGHAFNEATWPISELWRSDGATSP